MDAFEDENPFDTDVDRYPSEASSTSRVDLSAPASPPAHTPRVLSPTLSPDRERPVFPSPGTGSAGRSPRAPPTPKEDYCCYRDQWLHSGEDVEIVVCTACSRCLYSSYQLD